MSGLLIESFKEYLGYFRCLLRAWFKGQRKISEISYTIIRIIHFANNTMHGVFNFTQCLFIVHCLLFICLYFFAPACGE